VRRATSRGHGLILGAVLALLAGLLAGCSGVPDSSSPQKVRAVGGGTAEPQPVPTPSPGEDPRQIVSDFLTSNVSDQSDHNAAKGYLTPEARNTWSDTTATIVDSYSLGLFDATTDTVTLTGVQVGSLDPNGIYRPASQNDPGSQPQLSGRFVLKQVNGQWRIDKLSPGLLIAQSDFVASYRSRPLYYFDTEQQHLVPDPRWTALADQSLASWLLDQLVQPPRGELVNAVNPFPPSINAKDVAVTVGPAQLYTVELPGSSQLDPDARRRLAAQIAYTFGDVLVTITDKGRPVSIPGLTGPFGRTDFRSLSGVLLDPSTYYINASGFVADQSGRPLDGPLGHQAYGLTSIALSGRSDDTNLRAAGTAGPKTASILLVGRQRDGLKSAGVRPGRLSRPAWAPGTSEVWIGDGTVLRMVTSDGQVSTVPISSRGALTGDILAVRFSRDGTRIAMVIAGAGGVVQCVVGTVERGGSVRVDNLNPVTPIGFVPTDVAWNDGTTLYVSGSNGSTFGVWSVQSDGSNFTSRIASNLPATPTTITAAAGSLPWVGSGGGVFEQRTKEWTSPFGPTEGTVRGISPLYQE
jgi:Lipoprotein LpqB beta-propeller domain/Sporulation and spore germination